MHPKPPTKREIDSWFALLGISSKFVHEKLNVKTTTEFINGLDELKECSKKAWKKLAFDKHPDRNDGNDEEFKTLSSAYDNIQNLRVIKTPPRPQPMRVVHIHVNFGCTNGNTWTTGTGSTTGATFW